MFSIPSKFLIIILALLQLVTPLVHAHASDELADHRIHLPGLEHFNINNDSEAFHATLHPCVNDCLIIGVGAGIKHKKISTDNSIDFYLPLENFLFNSITHCIHIALPFRQQTFISTAHYTSLPARAPPPRL